MDLEIKLTKEKLKNFINNFDSEEFILKLARYREKTYFDNAVYKHFEIEINSYTKKITPTGLGEKIRDYIETMDKQKLTIIFEKEKKEYENFFEKPYFKDMEKLNIKYTEKQQVDLKMVNVDKMEKFKEKAVLYSILDMKEMEEIKKESIIYGQYSNFVELFFENVFPPSLFFSQKNYKVVVDYNKRKTEENFLYSFKKFFRNDVDVNPYYSSKLEKSEIVGEFTEKASGTIKKIFFDNYAKKNGITKISQEDIDEVTKEFQDYYRIDRDANKKIINKYFMSEMYNKGLKFLSQNHLAVEKIIEEIKLEYENYLQIYINKFPKNFTEDVVEFINKNKPNNLKIFSDKLNNENEFQNSLSEIEKNVNKKIDSVLKVK